MAKLTLKRMKQIKRLIDKDFNLLPNDISNIKVGSKEEKIVNRINKHISQIADALLLS